MGSFLSLLELASPLGSPLCAVAEEEGLKEGNLVENEITSHEGGALARDKRNVFFFFPTAGAPPSTLSSRFAN